MNLSDERKYVWNYFQLHATQRMTTFNFYVVIASLLTTALAGTFANGFVHPWLGVPLGVALAVISFVFWKLDQRVSFLIKHAESSLIEIEAKLEQGGNPELDFSSNLFARELASTKQLRTAPLTNLRRIHLSYADCFQVVYVVFSCVGAVGIAASLISAI